MIHSCAGVPTHPSAGSTMYVQLPLEEDHDSKRREAIREDLNRRLRRVCPEYSEEEFGDLLDVMTERQLKGERRVNRFP